MILAKRTSILIAHYCLPLDQSIKSIASAEKFLGIVARSCEHQFLVFYSGPFLFPSLKVLLGQVLYTLVEVDNLEELAS